MSADHPSKPGPGGHLHPVDWAAQAGATDDVLREMDVRLVRRRRQRLRMATVAGLVVLMAGVFSWRSLMPSRDAVADTPASRLIVSAPTRQELPDGSIVELKDGATISVDYNERMRRVTLQNGEAHFQVAKDPTKPFVVFADGIAVSAVGTAFSVQSGGGAVEVLVTEGRVAVDQPAAIPTGSSEAPAAIAEARPLAFLDAGKRLVVGTTEASAARVDPAVQTVSQAELNERLAWRVPRLEFSGTPLREIVPAVNRHSRVRLVIADARLEQVRLSGTLRADNLETLLDLLQEGYGVRVERRSDTEIALHKR